MFMAPLNYLFFTTLSLGVILSISSNSWFGAWCGLELNLMSFIPFISSSENLCSSEASLKYFLIQALGSSFIVLGAAVSNVLTGFMTLMTLALLLKLGVSPFHFWFPQVMEGLSWPQSLVLMTIQKIAPMYLLSYMTYLLWEISFVMSLGGVLSALVGGIGGINQMLLRKLLAYSSINHMSWMLFAMLSSEKFLGLMFLYFFLYALISSSIVMLFFVFQVYHFHQLMSFNKPLLGMVSFMCLLSLGGLPPFSGFLPKWILIQELVDQKLWFFLLVLLLSSLITLYYYIRMSLIFFNISLMKFKWTVKYLYNYKDYLFLISVNFLGLLFPSIFILLS